MFSIFLDNSASVFHPLPQVLAVQPDCSSKERKDWEFLTHSLPHAGVKGAQVRSHFCPGEEAHLLPQRGKSERRRAWGSTATERKSEPGRERVSADPERTPAPHMYPDLVCHVHCCHSSHMGPRCDWAPKSLAPAVGVPVLYTCAS